MTLKVLGKAHDTSSQAAGPNSGSLESLPEASWATSSQRRAHPNPVQSEFCYPMWLNQPQQEAPAPGTAADDDIVYHNMDAASMRKRESGNQTNNQNSIHSSSTGSVAQWFALETTEEDKLSCQIVTQEIKDVINEVFYFLKNRHWKKKLLTVLVVVASTSVMYDLMFGERIHTWIDSFLVWMADYPKAAEFVYMGIYVLASVLFIPPALLLFGGGWAFAQAWDDIYMGVAAATFACFFGSVIGALLSFIRSRYMMRDLIELFAERYPIVKAADKALKRDGLRIMFLLRLCPLIPFHGLNYLGGITGVPWQTFLVTLIGILPYEVMVIIMGATAGMVHAKKVQENEDHTETGGTDYYGDYTGGNAANQELQNLIMLIVTSIGVATFVIAMILAFRFTKKELQKELQIGEVDMRSYITTVRRMSMIDLYDNYRSPDMVETDDGMEIIKAESTEFGLGRSNQGSEMSASARNFIAMEASRLDDD